MIKRKNVTVSQAIWPILFFLMALIYGLFVQPVINKAGMLPLEVLLMMSLTFSTFYLMFNGYSWKTIESNIVKKVGESIPVVFILFSIGVLIGSWIVSGTIPMLIYYGVSIINPDWIYIFSFLICITFSLLTGTSWGSAGTIGLVMMGVSDIYNMDLCITAGAIVGGSFFGDKMSPLSDTTNIASLATGVPLLEHIHSMMYTTIPSAIIAGSIYVYLSPVFDSGTVSMATPQQIVDTMTALKTHFNFNLVLLVPLLIVIWGSMKKKPIVLTLLTSSWVALIIAIIFQPFSLSDIFASLNTGFNVSILGGSETDNNVLKILNRGGLYNLINGIVSCILIFAFIGTLDVINAIEVVIKGTMNRISTSRQLIASTLTLTGFTNLTTSNQYATSFIIAESFKKKYDDLNVNRKVLSRSIEDAGTMLENLMPWTPSGIFMASTLGVTALEYGPYQFLSLVNIVIAYILAYTGIGCFQKKRQ